MLAPGGNAIRVDPASLEGAASAITSLSGQAGSATGSFSAAEAAPLDCDPRASEACSQMHAALFARLTLASRATLGLGQQVAQAASSYVATDSHQMQVSIPISRPGSTAFGPLGPGPASPKGG